MHGLVSPSSISGFAGSWPMMGYGFGVMGSLLGLVWMLLMMLFPVVIISAVVYLIILAFRGRPGKGGYYYPDNGGRAEEHMDILKKRYANGEITKEQYEEMKNTLKGA